MAQKLDDKELAHPQEFVMANAIQIDAIAQLLIEKAIITEERNVSIKMRHPRRIIRLPHLQLKIGLFIHTACGRAGGFGRLPLNLFGCFSYAWASTDERPAMICSAQP